MDPVTVAILASQLVPAGVKLAQSIKQNKEAKEMSELAGDRPVYEIPDSIKQALSIAKQRAATSRLPGQELIEQNIKGSTSATAGRVVETAGSSAQALGALANVGASEQEQMQKLGIMGVQHQDQAMEQLKQMLMNYSAQEEKQFQLNQMEPYMQATAAASALTGASIQNRYSGLADVAGVTSNTLQHPEVGDWMNDMFKPKHTTVDTALEGSGYELSGDSGELNPEMQGWLDALSATNNVG